MISAFSIFFYLFAAMILAGAIAAVVMKGVLHAAFAMLLALIGVAGIYILLSADLLAVVQLLIFVGGIATLFVFGTMMTSRRELQSIPTAPGGQFVGGAIAVAMLSITVIMLLRTEWITTDKEPWRSTQSWNVNIHDRITAANKTLTRNSSREGYTPSQEIGSLLLTDYMLPFQLSAVAIVLAIVGGGYLLRERKETP